MPNPAWRILRALASLKVAIPLLVVLTAVTIIGSLFPRPGLFRSAWYLGLLALLGLSLLLITLIHAPRILRRKGRNALIGVIVTHAGILVLIAAAIQGGASASRWQFQAIEGEMSIVPGMPFVVELAALQVEEYDPEEFPGIDISGLPNKRQDGHFVLHRSGEAVAEFTAAPGRPGRFEGYTLLPSVSNMGWVFELVVTDRMGRKRTLLIRPWADPTFDFGGERVLAHGIEDEGKKKVRLLRLAGGQPRVFATIEAGERFEHEGSLIELDGFHRFIGVSVYNRPHMPLLVIGSLMMLVGLLWHFYHRYRD